MKLSLPWAFFSVFESYNSTPSILAPLAYSKSLWTSAVHTMLASFPSV